MNSMHSLDELLVFPRRARVLSLDGGGVRGLVTLQILLALEEKIKAIDPAQSIRTCFDLIGGTSTGGILAMALVATDMTISEINDLYKALPKQVFTGWNWWNSLKVSVGSALLQHTTKYSSKDLEELIDETFGKGRILANSKNSSNPDLKGFVTSTRIDRDSPEIYLFRSYTGGSGRSENAAGVHGLAGTNTKSDLSVTLKDALRATSAAPTYFPSIAVSPDNGEKLGTFVDGGFLANNPVEIAVAEAFELWPYRGVSTVLSLGTGEAENEEGGHARSNLAYAMTALELATESHRASARMEAMAKIVRLMAVNEVRAGLNEIDENHDGRISAREFQTYLAKFGIHKGLKHIPETLKSFENDNDMKADQDALDELFKAFKNELHTYHDFPEYMRLNTPHTVDGRRINLGKITLDTTDQRELDRMVDETNKWLAQPEVQEKLDHLAERLTHKKEECLEQLCSLPSGHVHRVTSMASAESGGLSSLDYSAELGGTNSKVLSEMNEVATINEKE